MEEVRKYKKKLTNSGLGMCIFSVLALIFALSGCLIEFVGVSIYNQIYTKKISHIYSAGALSYLYTYSSSIIMAAVSLIVMFILFSAKKKKKLSSEFAYIMLIISLFNAISPAVVLAENLNHGLFGSSVYDNQRFLAVCYCLCSVLPLLSCLILFFISIDIIIHLVNEKFNVEIETVKKKNSFGVPDFENDYQQNYDNVNYTNDSYSSEPINQTMEYRNINADNKLNYNFNNNENLCSKCGSAVPANAKFCKNCGNRM